jgi:hypothetical protein
MTGAINYLKTDHSNENIPSTIETVSTIKKPVRKIRTGFARMRFFCSALI